MGKSATSPIWQYFEKSLADVSFAICKKCKSKTSRGSTDPKRMTNTNLVTHLLKNHKDLYDQYKAKDKENN